MKPQSEILKTSSEELPKKIDDNISTTTREIIVNTITITQHEDEYKKYDRCFVTGMNQESTPYNLECQKIGESVGNEFKIDNNKLQKQINQQLIPELIKYNIPCSEFFKVIDPVRPYDFFSRDYQPNPPQPLGWIRAQWHPHSGHFIPYDPHYLDLWGEENDYQPDPPQSVGWAHFQHRPIKLQVNGCLEEHNADIREEL